MRNPRPDSQDRGPNAIDNAKRQTVLAASLTGLGLMTGMNDGALAASSDHLLGPGAPVRGGTLTRRIAGDPPSFDTIGSTAGWSLYIAGPCYNGLVRYDEFDADKVIPDLAESHEVSADGKAYTFYLRKGVRFHDGRPCTAEDVKYTFDVIRDPPKGIVSARANLLDAVESIVVVDPTTVRFQLKRKSPSLITSLAGGWMVVLPKHILEKGVMKDSIVGTGPFKFKEYKRGVSVELVRNAEYHIPNRPFLEAVKFFIIPDENTAYGYFRTGQIDEWVPPALLAQTREKELAGRAYLQSTHSTSSVGLHFNTQLKPFDDIRVRQAFCLAINRQQSLDIAFNGQGVTAGYSMPGKWALSSAELARIPGYAPFKDTHIAQAKALLAAAGFPNGFSETMLVRRIAIYEPHAVYLKDQLSKIGVDIKLDMQETATYNETLRKRQWKLDAGGISFVINDPDATFADSVSCDGISNFSKLCDAKTDDLVLRQSQEMDVKKRLALVNELEFKTLSQYGTYMMYFRKRFRMYQNNVHGWALHPNEDNVMRLEDCWKSRTRA
jgi:peptide/nickel transport system substrate-binding protein